MAWEQLLGIYTEAAQYEQEERKAPPSVCPADGTILKEGPGGTLFCPFDGLRWPEDSAAWGDYPKSW